MQGLKVKGIRTENELNNKRFLRFFNFIQNSAEKRGCVFYLDAGEGHDIITDELDGQDLSGWLIPKDEVGQFEPGWLKFRVEPKYADNYCMAVWEENGDTITVRFDFW